MSDINETNMIKLVKVATCEKIEIIMVEVVKHKKIETNAKAHRSKQAACFYERRGVKGENVGQLSCPPPRTITKRAVPV